MHNTIAESKSTLEATNSRLFEIEEWIRELEDRVVEITEAEQERENVLFIRTSTEDYVNIWQN